MPAYNNIKPNILIKSDLQISDSLIVHFIPDFESGLNDFFINFPFQKNKLQRIVINSGIIKIGNLTINPREYFNNNKSLLPKVYRTVSNIPDKNKYVIIDHSSTISAIKKLANVSDRNATFYLLNYLKNQYNQYKSETETIENVVLFGFNNSGLYDVLFKGFRALSNRDGVLDFFDKNVLALVGNTTLLIGYLDRDGKHVIDFTAFKKIGNLLDTVPEKKRQIINRFAKSFIKIDYKKLNPEILDNLISDLEISDINIENNIKSAINNYIKDNPNPNKDELNQIILITSNKTLYYSDKIDDRFIDDPKLLLKQVQDTKFFKEEIDFNIENKTDGLIGPNNDLIKIKEISGPVRHKHEFNENIHEHVETLFKTLENKSIPIKIKNIKHSIQDNNLNRYIEYKITVQNDKNNGQSEPYELKLQIPDIVNDRYFKLNGKEYILSTQQYLKPLTKSTHNEARFLTHFNMITQRLVNFKYSPSDLESIINYIYNFYGNITTKLEDGRLTLKSGTIIDLNNHEVPYESSTEKLVFENGKYYVYKDNIKTDIPVKNKTEYLYEKLVDIISTVNPNDDLKKSIRSLQYVDIHVMGKFIPFIFALWQQLGLTESLVKLGIDYEISEFQNKDPSKKSVIFKLMDDKFLCIYPKSKKEEYIINGLFKYDINGKFASKDLNNPQSCYEMLIENSSNKIINNLNKMMEISIDPVTKKLLERDNYPTNLIDITTGPLLDKLFNDPPDHPSDLTSLRARMSEYMVELIYNEIAMSYRTYTDKLAYDKDTAKMFLDEKYIIKNLLNQHKHSDVTGSSTIDYVEPFSPVDEIIKSSKVVKTGKGGVPSKQAFKKEHRNIHKTYIGNIAAHSTSESGDVGLINYHTLGALISDDNSVYGFKDRSNLNNDNWDSVSIDEALIPFVNSMHSDRLVIARTHMGQKIPILDGEAPLVQSGAEHIVGKIVSPKFAHKAKKNGKIVSVEKDKLIKVQYEDGSTDTFDVNPRFSATKRNSIIHITLDTLKEGDTFKEGELVAWSKAFNKGVLALGKNKKIAILNYLGKSHEDGYVISKDCAETFKIEMVMKIPVIIPPNTKIIEFNKNTNTNFNESLIRFQYEAIKTVDDYLDTFDITSDDISSETIGDDEETEDKVIENLYKHNNNVFDVKSPGGEIVKIKIRLNTKVNIDNVIINEWNKQNKEIKNLRSELSNNPNAKAGTNETFLDNVDTSIIKVGNHKLKGNEFEGALVEFYIKTQKELDYGDKITNRFGAKGVVNHIISKDKTPYGEFSGGIETFLAPNSVVGRKNTVIIKELYLGKILHFMKPSLLKLNPKDIKKTIIEVYSILDRTGRHSDYLFNIFENLSDQDIKNKLELPDTEFNFNFIVPPFNTVAFKDIKLVAEKLNIPLDEKVYIPELKAWSDPVPVGLSYMSPMEQLSSDYESTRATAGYNPITGQPLKRKIKQGGQSLGNLDVYSLLTYDCNGMLEELMTARSDNVRMKNQMINNIMKTGSTTMPIKDETHQGKTQDMFKIMMLSLGLFVNGKF